MRLLKSDEDLFRESTMTFGDHLEELRTCLFRALVGLVAGFIIGLLIGDRVVRFIQTPVEGALAEYHRNQTLKTMGEMSESEEPSDEAKDLNDFMAREGFLPEVVFVDVEEMTRQLRHLRPDVFKPAAPPPAARTPAAKAPVSSSGTKAPDPPAANTSATTPASANSSAAPARTTTTDLPAGKAPATKAALAKVSPSQSPAAPAPSLTVEKSPTRPPAGAAAKAPAAKATAVEPSAAKSPSAPPPAAKTSADATAEEAAVSPRPLSREDLVQVVLWHPVADDSRVKTQSLSPYEAFSIYLKAAMLVGVVLSSPWVFWQIWSFVAAGLYSHERYYVKIYLPVSLTLFLGGAAMAFFLVFPPVLHFLFGFNAWLGIEPDTRVTEWLTFVLIMPLAFGISFQMPLVMLFLHRIGIFTVEAYLAKWRVSILVIALVAALFTPSPDPWSMLLMGIPLVALYFGGILLCSYMPAPKRSTFEESWD